MSNRPRDIDQMIENLTELVKAYKIEPNGEKVQKIRCLVYEIRAEMEATQTKLNELKYSELKNILNNLLLYVDETISVGLKKREDSLIEVKNNVTKVMREKISEKKKKGNKSKKRKFDEDELVLENKSLCLNCIIV